MLGRAARRRRGEDGIVAVNITLFVALALTAVILLTATTVAALGISKQVKIAIQPTLASVQGEAALLPVLNHVDASAAQIQTDLNPGKGAPTTGDILNGIIGQTVNINSKVKSILANVGTIHTSVVAIHGKVNNIGADVSSIAGSVGTIHGSFVGINNQVSNILAPHAQVITANVIQIQNPVVSIHNDTTGILSTVGEINANANGIDCALAISGADCNSSSGTGTAGNSATGGLLGGSGGLLSGLGL